MYLTMMSRYCLKLYFGSFLKENKCIIFFSSRLCQFLKVLDLKGKSKFSPDGAAASAALRGVAQERRRTLPDSLGADGFGVSVPNVMNTVI